MKISKPDPKVTASLGIVRVELPGKEPHLFWQEDKERFYKLITDLCDACHVAFPDITNALPPRPLQNSEDKKNG